MKNHFYLIIIFVLLSYSIAGATDFWQSTNLTSLGGAFSGIDGKLYYTNGVSLYRSSDNGIAWDSLVSLPGGITFNGLTVATNGYIFIATNGAGLIRSTDNGTTWVPVNSGFSGSEARWPTISSSGIMFIGSASYGIYRSSDYGNSWTQVISGLTNLNIASIAIDSSGNIFTGVKGTNGLFKSTNNGDTWTLTSLTDAMRFYSLSVAPNGTIYAGSRYDPNAPNPNGVYSSTDNGVTWTHTGLSGKSINSSGVISAGNTLFVATDTLGVFRSTDNGATWDSVNTGLLSRYVLTLTLHNGYLYAGTYSGIFKSQLVVTSIREQSSSIPPSAFTLSQNYPNPFNPSTVISYSLSVQSLVTLKVYNVLGEEVSTLIDHKELSQGSYESRFDASSLSSGIYFYQLTTTNRNTREVHSFTKSMILIK